MLAPQITTSTGKTGIPGSLCKAMGPAVMATAAAAVSLHKATNGLPTGLPGPVKGPVQEQKVQLQATYEEATQWACKGCP